MIRGRAEGSREPFLSDGLRGKERIPCQTAEGVPVGLREVMATPVLVKADICHASDSHKAAGLYEAKKLSPHRGKIYQMARLSKILLCNL